jgi:enoyl-CoA hydratase
MLVEAKDLSNGVRVLTLNRPPANAISAELNDALRDQCQAARDDDSVRALVVTGAGKFFSGGMDLKNAVGGGAGAIRNLAGGRGDGIFALWTMSKPTVAMVNGHAIAGGAVIALACDFRITCHGDHKFGLNEVAIGLAFPKGAFEIVRLAMDSRQLRHALLEAGLHGAGRARELGFVDEVVDHERLEPRALEIAVRLAAHGRLAYANTKKYLQLEAVERVLAQTLERFDETLAVARSTETHDRIQSQVSAISKK